MATAIGIDLGTTNSEVAAFVGDRVRILGPSAGSLLPSCVGLSQSGELLIGEAARNQQLLYPERTVRSIKRKMGTTELVQLGDQRFLPQEISALILRQLKEWATDSLGEEPDRAVITVPAYFSDAQRQATREAGELAGFEVLRILNEPTAASLAYDGHVQGRHTVLVYDLGGGTFDVSIVRLEDEVTEVLASHGNNQLGGDDLTELLVGWLAGELRSEHGVELRREDSPAAYARLWWAAEEAKKKLSSEPHAWIREDNLRIGRGSRTVHLARQIRREDYSQLIRPLIESTMDSVTRAMKDAKLTTADLDAIILVGGSTRTPLVAELLEDASGLVPKRSVHPDLCVALGAGVLAARLDGHTLDRVLVDVSPYSFGISFLGVLDNEEYPYCYKPIIERNTALPVTRSEPYCTSYPLQEAARIEVFQGENRDALRNIPVGTFMVEGLTPTPGPNEILCRMQLDLDGILRVTATETSTGKSKHITIENALKPKDEKEIREARQRLEALYEDRLDEPVEAWAEQLETLDGHEVAVKRVPEQPAGAATGPAQEAEALLERSRALLGRLHPEDREDAIELHERIAAALKAGRDEDLAAAAAELRELLFFVEGQ